jgi:hypothetical protein
MQTSPDGLTTDASPQQDVLCLRPDVVATVLEDGAVLLDLESKYFYSVNSTGWAIVQLFERGVSAAEAHERCGAWGARAEDREALGSFIDALIGERLVVQATGASPAGGGAPSPPGWVVPRLEKHKEPLQRVMVSAFDPSIPLAE